MSFQYLRDRHYYEDLYDHGTVETCRSGERVVNDSFREVAKKAGPKELEERKPGWYLFYSLIYFGLVETPAAARAANRDQTISEWMKRDEEKDRRLKKLTDKTGFDIEKYLDEKQEKFSTRKSIFDLWRSVESTDNDVQKLVSNYATDYSKWWHAAENIESIVKANSQYENDYADSMEVNEEEVSFPAMSFYTNTEKSVNIRDWVWKRRDGATRFAFDSAAEEDWADILKDIASSGAAASIKVGDEESNQELFPKEDNRKNILLWGKNYVGNSEIKFEYYMGALHSSYPDFVMKDSKNRIHIFEVKSVNVASNMPAGFDASLYKAKVDELKKAYQQASKLTDQVFYLPVQTSDIWQITKYEDGNEDTLTIDQFESFIAV